MEADVQYFPHVDWVIDMHKFELDENYRAEGEETEETRIGEIYHVLGNKLGSGSISTPIARYVVWRPNYAEGVNPHWRIDCYVSRHKQSGDPKKLSRLLTSKMLELGLCDFPMWISWHQCVELGGEELGDLWEEA